MTTKKRRNYPGDKREVGTKDYGLILSNLINYRNQLFRTDDEGEILKIFLKISIKLKELGFTSASNKVKTKAKNTNRLSKKKEGVINIAAEKWKEGKDLHEAEKEKVKREAREAKQLLRKQRGWKTKSKEGK